MLHNPPPNPAGLSAQQVLASRAFGSRGSFSKLNIWSAFTPARTGWTDVGAPTVTGRSCKVNNLAYFQVKVVPATTTATVAGTSYIALPYTALGLGGDGSMIDLTTLIGIGNCVISVANSRIYVPTQTATGDALIVAGWFEA